MNSFEIASGLNGWYELWIVHSYRAVYNYGFLSLLPFAQPHPWCAKLVHDIENFKNCNLNWDVVFSLLAVATSAKGILEHLRHYTEPKYQLYICRILMMVCWLFQKPLFLSRFAYNMLSSWRFCLRRSRYEPDTDAWHPTLSALSKLL